MGTRRLAAALTLSTAMVGAALPGWASPPAPQPTASVATYVQGVRLPTSVATASWSDVTAGCAGRLTVSGPSVSGVTTVASGAMTSRWFRPRSGVLVSLSAAQGGNREWRPFVEGFDFRVRLRAKGHGWTPWWSLHMGMEPPSPPLPDLLVQVGYGAGIAILEGASHGHSLPLQQVQLRLVDSATSTGTLDDRFAVHMGC